MSYEEEEELEIELEIDDEHKSGHVCGLQRSSNGCIEMAAIS